MVEGRPSEIIPRGMYNKFKIASSNNRMLIKLLRDQGFDVKYEESYLVVKSDNHWYLYRALSRLEKYGIRIYRVEAVGASLEEVFRKVIVGE